MLNKGMLRILSAVLVLSSVIVGIGVHPTFAAQQTSKGIIAIIVPPLDTPFFKAEAEALNIMV